MKGRPMTNSHSSALLDPRSSAGSAARADRELNAAIVSAVSWSVRRRWRQSRVVGEYHYDHQQDGEVLGPSDLRIPTFNGIEEVE